MPASPRRPASPASTGFLGAAFAVPEPSDPVRLAREVMQDVDFWWKRLEPGTTPEAPWLGKVAIAVLDALARCWDLVRGVIGAIFRLLFGRVVGESSGGTILVWLLAAAILAWTAWKLVQFFVRRADRDAPLAGPGAVSSETLAAASDLREQAMRALDASRHADAIRLALLAMIAALEQRGLLRYDATRTNREYRAELRPRPELAERFSRLARIYERAWYGREPAGREQAEESIRLCAAPIDGEAFGLG